jgi:hypothetical protein
MVRGQGRKSSTIMKTALSQRIVVHRIIFGRRKYGTLKYWDSLIEKFRSPLARARLLGTDFRDDGMASGRRSLFGGGTIITDG